MFICVCIIWCVCRHCVVTPEGRQVILGPRVTSGPSLEAAGRRREKGGPGCVVPSVPGLRVPIPGPPLASSLLPAPPPRSPPRRSRRSRCWWHVSGTGGFGFDGLGDVGPEALHQANLVCPSPSAPSLGCRVCHLYEFSALCVCCHRCPLLFLVSLADHSPHPCSAVPQYVSQHTFFWVLCLYVRDQGDGERRGRHGEVQNNGLDLE